MNPWLEFLLSRAFDGALAPEHRNDLQEKSSLTGETIRAAYFRSVPLSMIPRLLGFDRPGVVSALLIPFRSPAGGFMDHIRMKIFPSLKDKNGHTVKYLGPKGVGPRLYFPAPTLAALEDPSRPLWLVEGEKKSLAVAQLGLAAVGFAGIEGWHRAGSRELLPDFDAINLGGRLIELLPDGDVQTNPNVERGAMRLGHALRRRGARVRLVLLPREVAAA